MSIRFGWTGPQAASQMTDEEHVEDVSSPPGSAPARSPEQASGSNDGPAKPGIEQVADIYELHARVVETER